MNKNLVQKRLQPGQDLDVPDHFVPLSSYCASLGIQCLNIFLFRCNYTCHDHDNQTSLGIQCISLYKCNSNQHNLQDTRPVIPSHPMQKLFPAIIPGIFFIIPFQIYLHHYNDIPSMFFTIPSMLLPASQIMISIGVFQIWTHKLLES